MTCKLKLQSKGNRLSLPNHKTSWRRETLVHVQIEFALTVVIWATPTRRGPHGGDDT